jgi:AI-2 transport protein TqsA
MTFSQPDRITASKSLINMAALIVVLAGMSLAKDIVVPVLLAGFIAVISAHPLFWLRKKGISNWLSLVMVILSVFLLITAAASLVGASIKDFTGNIPIYEARLKQQIMIPITFLSRWGIDISGPTITQIINPEDAMRLTGRILNGIGSILTNAFLILMVVIFILLEASTFPQKLRRLSPDPEKFDLSRVEEFMKTVNQYMVIKTVISIITGILIALFLWILGIDYPLLWGLLAFALNYIPNIGSILAGMPAVLLALIQFGLLRGLIVALGYLAVNLVMGNMVEPRYMGKGLGLSTLVVFLSLLFWGWLLGPVGMLLSVPLTMTVKIALDSREDSRWISILLGNVPGQEKAALLNGNDKAFEQA